MLQAGNYKVTKITDCFLGESKEKKTPYFFLTFELENGEKANWQVYLHTNFDNPKSKEIAEKNIQTLVKLGFKGSKISDMAEGSVDELFDIVDEEISVTIEIEDYTDKNGNQKQKALVKFVNVGTGYARMEKKQAQVVLKSLPYDGFLVKAKKEISVNVKKIVDPLNLDKFTSEEVPF